MLMKVSPVFAFFAIGICSQGSTGDQKQEKLPKKSKTDANPRNRKSLRQAFRFAFGGTSLMLFAPPGRRRPTG